MTKRKVFHSFHFDNDVFRVQQIRNMGIIEGNEATTPNNWEQLKRKSGGVEKWIDDNMFGKSCVIVLIGTETHARPWVKYEIKKAWAEGKGLLGIHIHNLNCLKNGTCSRGKNPFDSIQFTRRGNIIVPKVYNPDPKDAYSVISRNLAAWVEEAIAQ